MKDNYEKLCRFDGKRFDKQLKLLQKKYSEDAGCKVTLNSIIAELANRLSVSEQTLMHWKKGDNKPSDYDKVLSLAKALNISPEELEYHDNEKEPVNSMNNTNTIKENTVPENTDSNSAIDITADNMLEILELMEKYNEAYAINKSVISSVYKDISDFLETYRFLEFNSEKNVLLEKFNRMFRNLKQLRLEIPRLIFVKLEEFMNEYLYMILGIDNVLSSYIFGMSAEKGHAEFIEFVSELTDVFDDAFIEDRHIILEEYFKLKDSVATEINSDTIYSNPSDEVFCKSCFSNPEQNIEFLNECFQFAALFIFDLYEWVDSVDFFEDLMPGGYDGTISNPVLFKPVLIEKAYRHLDSILTAYIP